MTRVENEEEENELEMGTRLKKLENRVEVESAKFDFSKGEAGTYRIEVKVNLSRLRYLNPDGGFRRRIGYVPTAIQGPRMPCLEGEGTSVYAAFLSPRKVQAGPSHFKVSM